MECLQAIIALVGVGWAQAFLSLSRNLVGFLDFWISGLQEIQNFGDNPVLISCF